LHRQIVSSLLNTVGVALKLSAESLQQSNNAQSNSVVRMSQSGKFQIGPGSSISSAGGIATLESALVTKKVLTSAQRLLQSDKIDEKEYEQLIVSDLQ